MIVFIKGSSHENADVKKPKTKSEIKLNMKDVSKSRSKLNYNC